MTGQRLHDAYKYLTLRERFGLIVAADARHDPVEAAHLYRTCPRRAERLRLNDRLDRAFDLTARVAGALLAFASKLEGMKEAGLTADILVAAGYDDIECALESITGEVEPSLRSVAVRARRRARRTLRDRRSAVAAEGAVLANAFADFCEDELGGEARDVVAASMPNALELFDRFTRYDCDRDRVEELREQLAAEWQDELRV